MGHLNTEALSELLDGEHVAGGEEHLSACALCQAELQTLRRLRSELRELPQLEPPANLWSRIEGRLPAQSRRRRRLSWPALAALQVAAMAAVFVLGLGLGGLFQPEGDGLPAGGPEVSQLTSGELPPDMSLADALGEVRRRGVEYDAALRNLERLAQQEGSPMPSLARERLAGLDALVEASRTALAAEPADPVLNSYLFAALEERDAVVRQMRADSGSGGEVLWR